MDEDVYIMSFTIHKTKNTYGIVSTFSPEEVDSLNGE